MNGVNVENRMPGKTLESDEYDQRKSLDMMSDLRQRRIASAKFSVGFIRGHFRINPNLIVCLNDSCYFVGQLRYTG